MTRTGPAALALPATVAVVALWLVVACAVGGTQPHTAPPAATAADLGPTLQPVTPTIPPAIASTQAIQTSPPGSPNFAQPPAASLSARGTSAPGLLGSFCWHGTCLDAIPFTDREPDLGVLAAAGAGDQLDFVIAGGTDFIEWSASYVDDDGNVKQLGSVESSFDPDATGPSPVPLTNATFPAPPAGSQSIVQVFVRFAEGGDASYGWTVTVP